MCRSCDVIVGGVWHHGDSLTHRQGHGHDHVAAVDRGDVEDAGARVGVDPLHGAGRLAHARRGAPQGRGERPDGGPHQHRWVGLDWEHRRGDI